jgi:hypothetical protein
MGHICDRGRTRRDGSSSLKDLIDSKNPDANLAAAKAYEGLGNQAEAIRYYRRVYFFGAGSDAAKEAEAKTDLTYSAADPAVGRRSGGASGPTFHREELHRCRDGLHKSRQRISGFRDE